MSKRTKYTNNHVNNVIDTLNLSLDGGDSPGKDDSPSKKLEKLGN